MYSRYFSDNNRDYNENEIKENINKALEIVSEGNIFASQEFIEEAIQLCMESELNEEGLILTDALLEITPYNSELWNFKGSFLNNSYDFEEAYFVLEKAYSLNPNDTEILINLAISADNLGIRDESYELLNKALDLDPYNDEALFNLGVYFERTEDYYKAIDYIKRAIEIDKTYSEAWYELGYCYELIEKYDESLNAYDEFLQLEPYNATAWYNRGVVLVKKLMYQDAINCFELAGNLKEDFSSAWFNAGVANSAIGRKEEALKAFKNTASIEDTDPALWFQMGNIYSELNDYQNAINCFSAALEHDDEYYEAYLERGYLFSLIKENEKAENDLKKAFMEYYPEFISEHILEDSDFTAVEVCKELSEKDPENFELKYILVENLIKIGNWEDALPLVNECLLMDSENSACYYSKAKIYFKIGDLNEALQNLKNAFALTPSLKYKFAKDFPEINSSKLFNSIIDKK